MTRTFAISPVISHHHGAPFTSGWVASCPPKILSSVGPHKLPNLRPRATPNKNWAQIKAFKIQDILRRLYRHRLASGSSLWRRQPQQAAESQAPLPAQRIEMPPTFTPEPLRAETSTVSVVFPSDTWLGRSRANAGERGHRRRRRQPPPHRIAGHAPRCRAVAATARTQLLILVC